MGTDPSPPELTPADLEIIRIQVRKHMKGGFNRQDRQDARQEMAIAVLRQLPKLDLARGNRAAFVNVVAQSKIRSYIKKLRAQKRGKGQSPDSLHGDDGEIVIDPSDPEPDTPWLDAALFDELLRYLPPELREMACGLVGHKGYQVQKMLGLTRGQYCYRRDKLIARMKAWAARHKENPSQSKKSTATFSSDPVVPCRESRSLPSSTPETRP
jgi:DNA-directed RNA polymerase specialized sigma24 family protein